MALDIYVGSLTRYYAHEWQNVVERMAKARGVVYRQLRPTPADAVHDKARIRAAVLAWRSLLENALGPHLHGALDWDESDAAPYFTDRPDVDGWQALRLLAACTAIGRPLPPLVPDAWTTDKAWSEALEASPYRHVVDAHIWLPADFDAPFVAESVGGAPITFGSGPQLREELRKLNTESLNASPEQMRDWRRGSLSGAAIDRARSGLSIFSDLAAHSVNSRLPMLLDY